MRFARILKRRIDDGAVDEEGVPRLILGLQSGNRIL